MNSPVIFALANPKPLEPAEPPAGPPGTPDARTRPAALLPFRARLIAAVICLVVGLAFRLEGLRTTEPHPDEHHWVVRSEQVVTNLQLHRYSVATHHLPHPGLPAALTMAAFQVAAKHWNEYIHAEPFSRFYIDPLSASRIGNALISSMIIPLLMFTSYSLVGFLPVLLATILIALDCQHISLSRLAHIDGMLTLLSVSCLFLAFYAERTGSVAARLGAGALWGLAISTKPTAAALIGIIFTYKIARRTFCGRYLERPPAILGWSDIWAVLLGHALLGSLYTKLWDPNNTYLTKHNIQPPITFALIDIHHFFAAHRVLFGLVCVATILSAMLAYRLRSSMTRRVSYHASMLCLLFGALIVAIELVPHVMVNFARFWYWVGGLSKRVHKAYGIVWEPPGAGYPEMWARRLPAMLLVATALGVFFLVRDLRRIRSLLDAERVAFLAALIAAPVIWTIPLSVSSKQTVRYVVPMFPLLFLFAGWGLTAFCRFLLSLSSGRYRLDPSLRKGLTFASVAVFVLIQASVALSWAPNYSLYFNNFTGGLPAALERNFVLNPVGYKAALRHVHKVARRLHKNQRVEIVGDLDLMKYAYSRMYPPNERSRVSLEPFRDGYGSEWVLEFTSFSKRNNIHLGDPYVFEPVMELVEHGGIVFRLLKVHIPPFDLPVVFPLRQGLRKMGRLVEDVENVHHVVVSPEFARAGYIHFNQYVRVHPGKYRITFPFAREPQPAHLPPASSTKPIARVEFSTACTRLVAQSAVVSQTLTPVELICDFRESGRPQLSVYWFGEVAIRLGDISVQRVH